MASEVNDFEGLCNLVILEQFKNSLPSSVATYLTERKVKTVSEAAAVADEFVLIHKNRSSELTREPVVQKDTALVGLLDRWVGGLLREMCVIIDGRWVTGSQPVQSLKLRSHMQGVVG